MEHFIDGTYLRAFGPAGGVSFLGENIDPAAFRRAYYVKGTRGALCAELLGGIAARVRGAGVCVKRILSARRQGCAEGLILPEKRVVLLDGAYPNTLEPRFPAASETVLDTDTFIDADVMRRSKSALALADRALEREERRLARLLAAYGEIRQDSAELTAHCVNAEKLRRYAQGFANRELPRKNETAAAPKRVLLSSLSLREPVKEALSAYPRLIAVEDGGGIVSERVFSALADAAAERGLVCVFCKSPLMPEKATELLLIPAAGIAFFRAGGAFARFPESERTVHTGRFLDREALSAHKNRLSFNKKILRELSKDAFETAERICELQDVIDGFYIAAADHDGIDAFCERIAEELCKY